MLKKMFALAGAVTLLAGAAYAGETCSPSMTARDTTAPACCKKDAKTASVTKTSAVKKNLTEVRVCPMTGETVVGKGVGQQKFGAYNVHFCCAGCQPAFNKLSKAEQQKKVEAAVKKQNAAKKVA